MCKQEYYLKQEVELGWAIWSKGDTIYEGQIRDNWTVSNNDIQDLLDDDLIEPIQSLAHKATLVWLNYFRD